MAEKEKKAAAGGAKPKAAKPKSKKAKAKILMYKGKPFVRHENIIYYGNPSDKYIVTFTLSDFHKVGETDVAGHVSITLQYNEQYLNPKNKMIKKAERDDLWSAIDIGAFWLEDALEQG